MSKTSLKEPAEKQLLNALKAAEASANKREKAGLKKLALPPVLQKFGAPSPLFGLAGTQGSSEYSGVVTRIRNTSGKTLFFSWIPPHGFKLAANDEITINGDIESFMLTGSRLHVRNRAALRSAIENDLVEISRDIPQILHCPVDANMLIAAGDLVYLATDDIRPASSIAWNGNLATTQADFANLFVGVALDAHGSTQAAVTDFRVDISPLRVWRFACTSEVHGVDAMFGPAKAAGNALLPATLEKVSSAASAIARNARYDAAATTNCLVRIQSYLWGANAAAQQ